MDNNNNNNNNLNDDNGLDKINNLKKMVSGTRHSSIV